MTPNTITVREYHDSKKGQEMIGMLAQHVVDLGEKKCWSSAWDYLLAYQALSSLSEYFSDCEDFLAGDSWANTPLLAKILEVEPKEVYDEIMEWIDSDDATNILGNDDDAILTERRAMFGKFNYLDAVEW
jgi:hypothetical protein